VGACDFECVAFGKTAEEAFWEAVGHAQWAHGHAGYTGTVAEKDRFVRIKLPVGLTAVDYARKLIGNGDPRIDDKWGPAGCIEVPDAERATVIKGYWLADHPELRLFLFFGIASE